MTGFFSRDHFWSARDHDASAAVAALGAEVDHPVGGLHHVHVVLDDHHGIAGVAQAVQDFQQQLDVVEVQAGGGLVQDVERAPGVALGKLERQLHALRLAAGERGRRLAEAHVAQADVERLLEMLDRLVDQGNTVVVIEHNLDVIKTADHVIDIGPEGGDGGGRVVATGTPEQVAATKESYTGRFLADLLPAIAPKRAAR